MVLLNIMGKLKAQPDTGKTAVSTLVQFGLPSFVYFASQVLAFRFPDSFGLIAAIWPAAGIALASLLLSPPRVWPALLGCLFVVGLGANLTTDRPLVASFGFMVANVCETAWAAWLITRLCGRKVRFARTNECLALAGAVFAVNSVTSLIGAGAAWLALGAGFWDFYKTWWVADGLGMLLVTPPLVVWATSWRAFAGARKSLVIETAGVLALGSALTWLAFGNTPVTTRIQVNPYVLAVVVIYAAVRCGLLATTTLQTAMSLIAVVCTAAGLGSFPLSGSDTPLRLLAVQAFLGVISGSGLLLAAAITQQRQAQEELQSSEARHTSMIANISDVIAIMGVDGTVLYESPNVEQLFGWQPQDLVGTDGSLTVHPEDLEVIRAASARKLIENCGVSISMQRRQLQVG